MPIQSMLAAVYRGINDVRIEQVPVPQIGPGEALIGIDSCGVCGTDLKKMAHGLVPPPRIFGHEMAGTIAALGSDVNDWTVGDRVAVMHHVPCQESGCYYCGQGDYAQCPTYKRTGTTAGFEPAGGGFAQYIRVMDWVVRWGMVRIPDGVSFEEATFIEPVNTCLKALEKAKVEFEQTVLIIGQGSIGLLFTQLAGIRGAESVVTDPLHYRRDMARRFGAAETLDPDEDNVVAVVRARTSGRGADLAIVAVADTSVVAGAFEAVRPGGSVLLFAQTRLGELLAVDAGAVCMLEKDLIGSYSSDISLQDEAARLIFERAIDVRSLVTHRYPLEEIDCAIQMALQPRDRSLKVMVKA